MILTLDLDLLDTGDFNYDLSTFVGSGIKSGRIETGS
jgi:hypothetical protein